MTDRVVQYKRDDIWLADLGGSAGSEQGGIRPVLLISNDIGNRFSPVVIGAVISSATTKKRMPTHVSLPANRHGLIKDSFVGTEQLKTIDKWCLIEKLTTIDEETMDEINEALILSLGLRDYIDKKYIKRKDV
ncbi:type II toxin-antitoxin system PemK/MazF family toxin [Paenibacillus sp. NAIST15-1]|uniref:type II toxin-antitoxin system PemK/MazF family toxin n=1 Tax=Paenibacillus sp. NAIST15-1 TaxID=1605994 RepID=UPI00086E90D5|nr:type II toxin-antitoxin system PemK/MazF family toxin [Paenibacillus sp. NAIST15-1]GAV11339.1 transcriptional modulator of MazE/toxin, MazF [Paenibacillus sp. NAIST15-1]